MAETNELDAVLDDLKEQLNILIDEEDKRLESFLSTAHTTLKAWCGEFGWENLRGRQLVFDYVRFMRAGASEYFYPRFKAEIISFGFSLMEVPDEDTKQE